MSPVRIRRSNSRIVSPYTDPLPIVILMPLYSGGLWEPVICTAPSAAYRYSLK